jgi:hypothetical protein
MSSSDTSGFGKFVPGFEFLQGLAKGTSSGIPQMPNIANWVAPTLNVEELDKRIEELRNVQFWLEQNSRALAATIQALEVQRMTLATLKGMNFNLADVASAFQFKMPEVTPAAPARAAAPAPEPEPPKPAPKPRAARKPASKATSAAAGGLVDPLQLWGSLTQQFQQIAASAMKDVAAHAASEAGKAAASAGASAPAAKAPRGRPAAGKTAPKPPRR